MGRAKTKQLAYSEGLASYMGQTFLQTPHYLAIHPNGKSGISGDVEENGKYAYAISLDLENSNKSNINVMPILISSLYCYLYDQYELVVMRCLWDLDDTEISNEPWDRMSNSEKNIFNINQQIGM